MFKQKLILEVKAGNDRIHTFSCEPDSPLGEVYDALCVMKSHVFEQIKAQEEKEKPKECEEACEKPKDEEVNDQKS